MRRAYHHPDPLVAQAELEALARELDRSHPGAASSLREGGEAHQGMAHSLPEP
jgi:putative transposase